MPDQKPTLEYVKPATRRDDTIRSLHRFDRVAVYGSIVFLAICSVFFIALFLMVILSRH